MENTTPPDDLVTITEGTHKTSLTWAQINYAVNMRFLPSWSRGLKKVRYVSLAALREYERQMTEFRPLRSRDDEGNGEE